MAQVVPEGQVPVLLPTTEIPQGVANEGSNNGTSDDKVGRNVSPRLSVSTEEEIRFEEEEIGVVNLWLSLDRGGVLNDLNSFSAFQVLAWWADLYFKKRGKSVSRRPSGDDLGAAARLPGGQAVFLSSGFYR